MNWFYVSCPKCDKDHEVDWGDEASIRTCDCGTTFIIMYDEYYDEENNDEYNYWWAKEVK
jgi:phage terminase large subunit GpA-like protein